VLIDTSIRQTTDDSRHPIYINDDGSKKFLTGSKKSGSFFILGQEILKTSDIINYAEGYATAASIYADYSQPVVVSFDAYNLSPVAEVMS
jgi:putative DNA primase/helicase